MQDQEQVPPNFPESLRRLCGAGMALLHNRLELLVVELHEDRLRLLEALLLLIAIVALGLLTLALAAAGVIVLVWSSFHVMGLFVLSAIGLAATLLAGWRLHFRLKNWPLLPGTFEQLKKDRECLESK
ncbi:MAG TPA: phage holin family protein [Verrucomicrobiae bacterium]|nr:phage holin family protein [Verrucomicrobiae bacterium]